MIGFVIGVKGAGKTKRMVGMANAIADEALGNVVFIDDGNDRMHDIKRTIRLVEGQNYQIESPEYFCGFIGGLLASDFDLHTIFVDSFLRILNVDLSQMKPYFEQLERLSDAHDVRLIISISGAEDEVPEYIREKALK